MTRRPKDTHHRAPAQETRAAHRKGQTARAARPVPLLGTREDTRGEAAPQRRQTQLALGPPSAWTVIHPEQLPRASQPGAAARGAPDPFEVLDDGPHGGGVARMTPAELAGYVLHPETIAYLVAWYRAGNLPRLRRDVASAHIVIVRDLELAPGESRWSDISPVRMSRLLVTIAALADRLERREGSAE